MALRSISTLSQEEKNRKETTQQFLTAWISKNKDDYIAHAIWEDNVEKVLKHGALVPAECQLRQNGEVSFEGGMIGLRDTRKISSLVSEFKEKKIDLPKKVTLENKMPLEEALQLGFIRSYATLRRIADEYHQQAKNNEPYFFKLKDGKDYLITFTTDNMYEIHGIPYLKKHTFGAGISLTAPKAYPELLEDLRREYGCHTSSIEIVIDMLAKIPIDKTLALMWEKYKELTYATDHRKYARQILEYRKEVISNGCLTTDIRAGYKGIWWNYGDVAILSGDAEEKLSVVSKGMYDHDMETKIEDFKLSNRQEVFLLNPFENKGQFYTWDLTKEGTIIIGPQNILMPFQTQAKSRGMKLFYIEDMSNAQLEFFLVPFKLCPTITATKKILSITSKIEAKSTSLFFKRWHTQTQQEKAKEAADNLKIKNFRDACDKRLMTSMFRSWSRETKSANLIRKIGKENEGICPIM